jgi:hypothetical protein
MCVDISALAKRVPVVCPLDFEPKTLVQGDCWNVVGIHTQFDPLDVQPVISEIDCGAQERSADAFALPIVTHRHPELRDMTATRLIHRSEAKRADDLGVNAGDQ